MHGDRALRRERVGRVFALLNKVIEALRVHPNHRELLRIHLRAAREEAEDWPEMSAIQVPLLVHTAVTGDEKPAVPVAAACTFLGLGADLYDSILDHELPPYWHTCDPAEVNLTATTLMATLPQLSIAHLQEQGTPPARLWTLAHHFADTLQTMIAGEYEDLLFPKLENVSLVDSRAMVERKSGSANALFARAGAILATEDSFTIEAYANFGLGFGMAKQLINDVWGIWGQDTSRDLLNGKRTLPIVYALATLGEEKSKQLRRLLAAARESSEHHDEVRALLEAAGSVRYTALIVGLYQQQARDHLAAASPQEPAGEELHTLLDRASLIRQREEAPPSN